MKKYVATFQIHYTFKITGRGIVCAGFILDGEFTIGDFIRFDFKGNLLERRITDMDAGMIVIEGKPNVGIMIGSLNDREIDDLKSWHPNLAIGKIYSKNEA